MDLIMKSELRLQDEDPRVLWEEDLQPKTSILEILFPPSNLNESEIKRITYIKKVPGSRTQIHGAPVFDKEWRLEDAFRKKRKVQAGRVRLQARTAESQTDTDVEGDSMLETDSSVGQQTFIKAGKKRAQPAGETEEKKWERLFRMIYYHMRELLKAQVNADGSQLSGTQRPILPFTEIADLRYWSSDFANKAVPDDTESRTLDLALLDYRLRKSSFQKSWKDVLVQVAITQSDLSINRKIPLFLRIATKGYMMMQEQPWRRFILLFSVSNYKLRVHYMDRSGMVISKPLPIVASPTRFVDVLNTITLANRSSLGFDPTMHICNSCDTIPNHTNLPNGFGAMIPGAIGWIYDDEQNVYWIMAILWKSRGLFGRGTVCYRVQDQLNREYALKDFWVNEDVKDVEIQLLEAVKGIPNVVELVKYWDVLYDGQPDSTSHIRSHCSTFEFERRIHRRLLLTPCGLPLTHFKDVPELIGIFRDVVVAHKAMVGRRVLHGDLSPNNIIICGGKGYLIDLDHAKFLNDNGKADATPLGTGTVPYMSFRVLCLMGGGNVVEHMPSDDLESLLYILLEFAVTYIGPKGAPAPQPSEEASYQDPVRRWRDAYEINPTYDGLAASGVFKQAWICGLLASQPLITSYFILCRPLLEEWRHAISDASTQSTSLSHDSICDILTRGLSTIRQQLEMPPPAPPSATEPTIASSHPPASTSQQVATVTVSHPDPPLAVRRARRSTKAPAKNS